MSSAESLLSSDEESNVTDLDLSDDEGGGSAAVPSQAAQDEAIAKMMGMGFRAEVAKAALEMNNFDTMKSVSMLMDKGVDYVLKRKGASSGSRFGGASSSTDVPANSNFGGASSSTDIPPAPDAASSSSAAAKPKRKYTKRKVAEVQEGVEKVAAPGRKRQNKKRKVNEEEEDEQEQEQEQQMVAIPAAARGSVVPVPKLPKRLADGSWQAPAMKVRITTAINWLQIQRQAIFNMLNDYVSEVIDFEPVPAHPSVWEVNNPSFDAEDRGDVVRPVDRAPNLSATGQVLVTANLDVDKSIAEKAIKYWWEMGHNIYVKKQKRATTKRRRRYSSGMRAKFQTRFEALESHLESEHPLSKSNHGDFLHGECFPQGFSTLLDNPSRRQGMSDYWRASLSNVSKLKKKADKFISDGKLFSGVLDEQSLSGLGLPAILCQDPDEFGFNLGEEDPDAFDSWKPFEQSLLKDLDSFRRERDMNHCLTVANIFNEEIFGQCVSHWFYEGSAQNQPFGLLTNSPNAKSFCERCKRWCHHEEQDDMDKRKKGEGVNIAVRLKLHVQQCLRQSQWNFPANVANMDGDTRIDTLQTLRLFRQHMGSDIGINIQFKYLTTDSVQVKICATFSSLLRRMLYMGYWPHDAVTARWRMTKEDTSYDEDHVTTMHREPVKTFAMKNSLDMAVVPSPPCFVHCLKGEQPYTLSWMYSREGRTPDGRVSAEHAPVAFKTKQSIARRVAGSDVKVEVELERSYDRIRGGILGDQVGYGKTACMIALIAQTHLQDPMQVDISDWEKPYAKEYIFSNATMIVTPANLFDQWHGEFNKFINKAKVKLNIIRIGNHTAMKRYQMKDFVKADVVLVSERFFFSEAYRKYFDSELSADTLDRSNVRYFTNRIALCKRRTQQCIRSNQLSTLLDKKALFEAFYWKRVVFDEFHDVVKGKNDEINSLLSYYALRHLQSRYHWGLTATPLINSANEVSQMASLLHIFLPSNDSVEAQHFVDTYIRANKWNVGDVPMEEKWMKVSHTPEERALYLHHEQQAVGAQGVNQLNTQESEKLLQFCSHFSPDGSEASAGNAIDKVRKMNEANQKKLQEELKEQKVIFDAFSPKEAVVDRYIQFMMVHTTNNQQLNYHDRLKRITRFMLIHSTVEELTALLAGFNGKDFNHVKFLQMKALHTQISTRCCNQGQNQQRHQYAFYMYQDLNKCNFCKKFNQSMYYDNFNGGQFRGFLSAYDEKVKSLTRQIEDLKASLRFLDNTIKSICEVQDGDEAPECSYCMEPMSPETTIITQCGHAFHEDCLREVLAANPICPLCRAPASMQQATLVRDLPQYDQGVNKVEDTPADVTRQERRKTVGSKITAIVELIEQLRSEKPREKVVIFIQWKSIREPLLKAIESALGFDPHVLQHDTRARSKTLKSFREGTSTKDQLLVLSIEESATGINLPCANHCILVHPMFGSHKHATDCEKQAIGRIRRQGQERTCYVYRFYTEGTIEERLMKEHSKELDNMAMPEEDEYNRYNEPVLEQEPALDAHSTDFCHSRAREPFVHAKPKKAPRKKRGEGNGQRKKRYDVFGFGMYEDDDFY